MTELTRVIDRRSPASKKIRAHAEYVACISEIVTWQPFRTESPSGSLPFHREVRKRTRNWRLGADGLEEVPPECGSRAGSRRREQADLSWIPGRSLQPVSYVRNGRVPGVGNEISLAASRGFT